MYILAIFVVLVLALILNNLFFEKDEKKKQTTFCYCPECNNELIGSNSFTSDGELVMFVCTKCGTESEWDFDAPAPLLLYVEGEMYKYPESGNNRNSSN